MRMKFVVVLIVAFTMLGTAYSQIEKSSGQGQGRQDPLELTEDQKEQIEELRISCKKDLLPLKNKLKVMDAELQEMVMAENPDSRAINKKIEGIGSVRTEIQKIQTSNRLKIRGLLTEKQRVLFGSRKSYERELMYGRRDFQRGRRFKQFKNFREMRLKHREMSPEKGERGMRFQHRDLPYEGVERGIRFQHRDLRPENIEEELILEL